MNDTCCEEEKTTDGERERYRRCVTAAKQREISREMGGGSENPKGEKGCRNGKTRVIPAAKHKENLREMGSY